MVDDPHLWATALFDEVVALGYQGSYPSFTRALRARSLRPHCEPCRASAGRDHAIIVHPPGAETIRDYLDGKHRTPLRGMGHAESEDQPHLVQALDGVVRRLGVLTGEVGQAADGR